MPKALLDSVTQFIQQHAIHRLWVAYSGGLDSHVLLHLLSLVRQQKPALSLRAVHINHQLQAVSQDWVIHCQQVCQALAIDLQVHDVAVDLAAGKGLEAAAREARYQVFSQVLTQGGYLFTAHHQDDQAETVLLQALRGSGVDGLAAMPAVRSLVKGTLARPLLGFSRAELQAYAEQHQLNVIEDPSNQDHRFQRNFLRHEVLPLLQQRWPSAVATLSRVAALQQEQLQLQQLLLQQPLQQAQGIQVGTLSVSHLKQHDEVLQKALIRQWIKQQGYALPEAKKLQHVLTDVVHARVDAMPCVQWADCEVRRYQDDLYIMPPLKPWRVPEVMAWDGRHDVTWGEQLLSADALGQWREVAWQQGQCFVVRAREGGEKLLWCNKRRPLKKVLQAQSVPPWQRERLALVYLGEEIVYIAGLH